MTHHVYAWLGGKWWVVACGGRVVQHLTMNLYWPSFATGDRVKAPLLLVRTSGTCAGARAHAVHVATYVHVSSPLHAARTPGCGLTGESGRAGILLGSRRLMHSSSLSDWLSYCEQEPEQCDGGCQDMDMDSKHAWVCPGFTACSMELTFVLLIEGRHTGRDDVSLCTRL